MKQTSLNELLSGLPQVHANRGDRLLSPGQACTHYLMPKSGSARVIANTSDGKAITLYHIEPGDICVLSTSCLFAGSGFPAEVIADTDITAYALDAKSFLHWMDQEPAFRQFVFDGFSHRVTGLIEALQIIKSETIDQRIARYLISTGRTEIDKTHQEVASEISSSREVVSRRLKQMEKLGVIELMRGKLLIKDHKQLKDLLNAKH